MNRRQRRASKDQSQGAPALFQAGNICLQQKQYVQALNFFIQAFELEPNNKTYILHLCHVLKNVSFSQFNAKAKSVILRCLSALGIDHQSLWRPWFSLLMCDPDLKDLQKLIRGEDYDAQKLHSCLKQPYFLAGLNTLICFDPDFEQALCKLQQSINSGAAFPKTFTKALDIYCDHCEYVFCDVLTDRDAYPIDSSIPVLSVTDDAVSQNVRKQYEANPYPRWFSCNVQDAPQSSAAKVYDHLIAGCGTGWGVHDSDVVPIGADYGD